MPPQVKLILKLRSGCHHRHRAREVGNRRRVGAHGERPKQQELH